MAGLVLHPAFKAKLTPTAWAGWTWRVAMLNGWTPDVNAHNVWADASAFEVVLAGYTAGGKLLVMSAPVVEGDNRLHYRASDATWASIAVGTVSRAALLAHDGTTNWIAGHIDVSAVQPDGGAYAVRWGSEGVLAW